MTLTLTSEDKAKAIALFVQGDVRCLCGDPCVVLRGWGEMEGSFESLSHITKPQTSPKLIPGELGGQSEITGRVSSPHPHHLQVGQVGLQEFR